LIELKERLAAIAEYVPQGSVVVDVGTDHAYLPVYLVQTSKCARTVGIDVHQGPYRSAVEQVESQGLEDRISIFLGDGLKTLSPGQADVVVIAGMGGTSIIEILKASPEVLDPVRRLILQPMVAGAALRLYLLKHGWTIVDEQLVEEEKRIYEIIVAERGEQGIPAEAVLEFGPCIIAKQDPLLPQAVMHRVRVLENVLLQMERAQNPEVENKRKEVQAQIMDFQGVLR